MGNPFTSRLLQLAASASALALLTSTAAAPASAQEARISVPALPLVEALQRIQAATGTTVDYDPDAVRGLTSVAVRGAPDAEAAVRAATAGARLAVQREGDGRITVLNDIVVIARRDEAETSLLVRDATTSTRDGQSLRDQPRNTQVISSRLMAEQQSQTLVDALRNAGGVSVNTATVQGGVGYTVRGFGTSGVVNGMPANNGSFAAGATQPIANIERLEVLKGPDALLAGADNLGGTVNIVTKKPSAEPYLYVSAETGSFGQVRGTVDATTPINESRTVSARIVATAASSDRNYGGYKGNEDYLYAPSARFKNANTDIILGATLSNQITGTTPYVPANFVTWKLFDVPVDRPLIPGKNQGAQITSTMFNAEITQKFGDWLTLVGRGQHQQMELQIGQYAPFAVLTGTGTILSRNSRIRQTNNSDAIDTYARVHGELLGIDHTVTAGYTHVSNDMAAFSSSGANFFTYNILTRTAPVPARAPIDTTDYDLDSTQNGYYAQYLGKLWQLSVVAGVRRNDYKSTILYPDGTGGTEKGSATVPNFGVVLDVTPAISLFGALVYGYYPTFALDRNKQKLPDVKSRNMEAGAKIDLFGDRMVLNASVFRLRQSNRIIGDPEYPNEQIAVTGQEGTGIDLNLSGQVTANLTLQASYTRTTYKFLTETEFGNIVAAQPKDQYSFYGSYRRDLADDVSGGIGLGVFGRSSASANSYGDYYVPPAFQVDLNSFLKIGALDLNLGVRNVLDRRNYNITYSPSYVPVSEPRNWRLTMGYRFK